MTLPAVSTPARLPTLEQERTALQQRDTTLNEGRKALALDLHRLRLRWQMLYPRSSTREFIGWYGEGEVAGRLYAYLKAGLAADAGLDRPGLLFGELTAYGERLEHGELPADLLAGAPSKVPEKTSIRVTRETAAALDATFAELSESDTRLTRQDALETTVQAFAHAPPAIRRALVHSAATGENPLDALVQAVEERRDYRNWLSQRGCLLCGVRPVQLHHLKTTPDTRFRSQEVLAPLCERHHIARVGDTTDAAHAAHQPQWIERHFQSEGNFWMRLALLYVEYARTSDTAQEAPP